MPYNKKRIDKVEYYHICLNSIKNYFGVSDLCSAYLYHRSFRGKRRCSKYMCWHIKLQNALVKADKCLGIDWNNIKFGLEDVELKQHGIVVDEMLNDVFRWYEEKIIKVVDDGWTTVVNKKRTNNPLYNIESITRSGLYI
jgi:hypothetical protein